MKKISQFNMVLFATGSLAVPTWVWAQPAPVGYVDYGPAPTAIPTLTEVGIMGLALLLAFTAYQSLRRNSAGYPFAILVATAMAVVGSIAGVKLMNPAQAGLGLFLIDGGSTAEVDYLDADYPLLNTASYIQQIRGIRGTGCPSGTTPAIPIVGSACKVGDEIPPDNQPPYCYVRFENCDGAN